ncbi:hypothetical protein [Streptomyces sp. TRM64462]|uniref:hypothetical protein n=1 Tax=Streptomyces sp. TRM64462 TaxID=2741726 RepID=UPI001586C2E3|nr:hypothetical protein [Streptomyces sp. TRM64462]
MSTLTMLVLLLLVLVVILILAVVGYVAFRHPRLRTPLLVVFALAGVFATFFAPLAAR